MACQWACRAWTDWVALYPKGIGRLARDYYPSPVREGYSMKFMVAILALLVASISSIAAHAGDSDWVLASNKNGIKVYRKLDDESRIKTFRGVTRFRLENPAAIEALLQDYEAAPRWLYYVSKATELGRINSMENTVYAQIHLPWPLADRDVVADLRFEKVSDNTLVLHGRNVWNSPSREGYLRIPNFKGEFRMTFNREANDVEMTYEVVVDPGGKIPAWAANFVLKDMPYFTLLKIRRIVAEPKYANAKGAFLDYAW